MKPDLERNLGEQPISDLMKKHGLKPHALVDASTEHITHKMVTRACKGRRLTKNVKSKILNSLNKAAETSYTAQDLFTY